MYDPIINTCLSADHRGGVTYQTRRVLWRPLRLVLLHVLLNNARTRYYLLCLARGHNLEASGLPNFTWMAKGAYLRARVLDPTERFGRGGRRLSNVLTANQAAYLQGARRVQ
jgi:hypothetical protein